jgi:hypothetical protein
MVGLEWGDRLFSLRVGGVTISAEIGVMATMATSDAQKRATKNYSQTEKGKEARLNAVKKHQATEHGQEVLKAAQERYASSEKAKDAKRRYESSEKKERKTSS